MKNFLVKLTAFGVIVFGIFLAIIAVLCRLVPLDESTATVDPPVKDFAFGFAVLAIGFIVIAIGILLKKNWARISVLIISGMLVMAGFLICILILFALTQQGEIRAKVVTGSLMMVLFLIIPAGIFSLFNNKSVKDSFAQNQQKQPIKSMGILLVVLLIFSGALNSLTMLFNPHIKVPMFGMVFEGVPLFICCAVETIISIYIGIGILKFDRYAWYLAMGVQIISIVFGIINVVMMSEALLVSSQPQFPPEIVKNTFWIFKYSGLLMLIVPIYILIYLYLKRNLFISSLKNSKIPGTVSK